MAVLNTLAAACFKMFTIQFKVDDYTLISLSVLTWLKNSTLMKAD